MLNFLRQSTGLRGATGVIAAYALALQMLLAGMAGAQMAAADPVTLSVICYAATEGGHDAPSPNTGKPVNHVTCVVCSVASLAPQLPEAATPVVIRFAMAAAYVPPRNAVHAVARRHDPKSSQGPPQTA